MTGFFGLLFLLTAALPTGIPAVAHQGVVVGHSPASADGKPPCPTVDPLKMFLLPDPRIGGPIAADANWPGHPGQATIMTRLATNALLARPEFGGFGYVADTPGLDYVDAGNKCHAMTTAHTGGMPFTTSMQRIAAPAEAHFAMADPFGVVRFFEDGDTWMFGSQAAGHSHPFWLMRRAGRYAASYRIISNFFDESDEFSLVFEGGPDCFRALPLDLSTIFNADVVDSDLADMPISFDGAGQSWVLNGLYGTARGLPGDGRLDAFQLGGPGGAGLLGDGLNCLFDGGTHSSQATVDLVATNQSGFFESMELLLGAAGTFTSSDVLTVRVAYASGMDQEVTVKRAAASPNYFPLLDWRIEADPIPHLSIGPGGDRQGGGFVRSTGSGIDNLAGESIYFRRVTFPVDVNRAAVSITFDDYTGAGRIGVFAVTAFAQREPNADYDDDGAVGLNDYALLSVCLNGPLGPTGKTMCLVVDSDCDEDVDLLDYAQFQNELTE